MPDWAALLREGTGRLAAAGIPDAGGDARRLLAGAIRAGPAGLAARLREGADAGGSAAYEAMLRRRLRREPVSQILGRREFWGRGFRVTADVLDPRPETEILVAAALEEPFARVLDLGTGSGCLLVTLLAERPGATGLGIDASEAALDVARGNARALGVAARAEIRRSDWLAGVEGTFDLVVANPPYVAQGEMAGLAPELRDWEPAGALTDGGDGLGAYRAILGAVGPHLAPGGRLLLEMGPTQAAAVAAIAAAAGLPAPQVLRDLDGRDRVAHIRRATAESGVPQGGRRA